MFASKRMVAYNKIVHQVSRTWRPMKLVPRIPRPGGVTYPGVEGGVGILPDICPRPVDIQVMNASPHFRPFSEIFLSIASSS